MQTVMSEVTASHQTSERANENVRIPERSVPMQVGAKVEQDRKKAGLG